MRSPILAAGLVFLAGPAAAASVADFHVGLVVEAQGDVKPTRGFVADEIDARRGFSGNDVEIVAPIETMDASRSLIRVLATDVRVDAQTEGSPFESFAAGHWVEIDGTWENGVLRARRIRAADGVDDVEIDGAVTSVDEDGNRLIIAGIPVALSGGTVVRGIQQSLVQRAIDDDDEAPALGSAFGGRLRFGGRLQGAVQPEDNYDLNPDRQGDLTESDWFGELLADARLGGGVETFAKAGWTASRVITDQEGDEENTFAWRLQQAYAAWSPPAVPDFAVQLGRQDFDEPREWLYDENLDGIRLHARRGRVRGEASLSTRWNTDSGRLEDWTNWIVATNAAVADRCEAGAYLVHRRRSGLDADDRPVWFGVRSRGRLAGGLHHWTELALLRGELDGVSREAWATDVGVRLRLERRTRLSVTAGWAAGSGGDDEAGRFRQTGLHDNNDKFGGASSFRYYGELLDPELSNLEVLTAGVGVRPLPSSSIDIVFHRYTQRRPVARLEDSNLDSRPDGLSTDIGEEWDLVAAFEEIPWMDVEYVFAVFAPGEAFEARATSARAHKLQLQVKF
ncbi:MAG: alginate export family protein [Candidatus Eiseniibacteriota bacterium]